MISQPEFHELFMRIMKGQLSVMLRAESPAPLADVLHTVWKACQPGVTCTDQDFTEQAQGLLPGEVVTGARIFFGHREEKGLKLPVFIYVDGHVSYGGDLDPGALHKMILSILVDEHGLDRDACMAALGEIPETLSKAFTKEQQAQIDKEVEAFAEEINTKIDSIFKRGGDT